MQPNGRVILIILLGSGLLSMAGAAGPDTGWPMFRGNPALLGVARDPLPEKPALLWTFKTGGPVKSSAVISGVP